MKISVQQVVEAAECRMAAVTAETSGFIVLQAVRAYQSHPVPFSRREVQLSSEGEIFVTSAPDGAKDVEAVEAELLQLLVELLQLTRAVPPALTFLAGRAPRGKLEELEGELLAALIPFNPSAARRGLARLYREVCRARSATKQALEGSSAPAVETQRPERTPPPAAVAPPKVPAAIIGHAAQRDLLVAPEDGSGELHIEIDYEARRASSLPPAAPVEASEPDATRTSDGLREPSPTPRSVVRVTLPMPDPDMRGSGSTAGAEPLQLNLFSTDEVADDVDELLEPMPTSEHDTGPTSVSALAEPIRLSSECSESFDTTPCTAPPRGALDLDEERRSNLDDLMKEFLAHTRSERVLSANLRSLVGVEIVPAKNAS